MVRSLDWRDPSSDVLGNFLSATRIVIFQVWPVSRFMCLVDITKDCLFAGIEEVKPGATLGDIGFAIQSLAESNHYSVVRDYCGHGIGKVYHEEPQIMHYGNKGEGLELQEGMTFTIEPMINLGTYHSKVLNDGWTVVTKDGKLSAQWEHTVAVTGSGYEILTLGK